MRRGGKIAGLYFCAALMAADATARWLGWWSGPEEAAPCAVAALADVYEADGESGSGEDGDEGP